MIMAEVLNEGSTRLTARSDIGARPVVSVRFPVFVSIVAVFKLAEPRCQNPPVMLNLAALVLSDVFSGTVSNPLSRTDATDELAKSCKVSVHLCSLTLPRASSNLS